MTIGRHRPEADLRSGLVSPKLRAGRGRKLTSRLDRFRICRRELVHGDDGRRSRFFTGPPAVGGGHNLVMCPLARMPTIEAFACSRSTDVTRGFKVAAKPNDKGSGRIRPFAASDFLDTLPGCAPEPPDEAPQPASTMLVLPIAGAERGRSESPPALPPVSTSLLAAGAGRRPGRIKEEPPSGAQTNRGESSPAALFVASPNSLERDRARLPRAVGPGQARRPVASKMSVQPAPTPAPQALGAVEVSPGFAARGAFHPAVAPTPLGRTGGPVDAYRARAAHLPRPVAPTSRRGRRLGLVLLCCAALASAAVIHLWLGRAMHATRIAAISAAPAATAAISQPMTRALDERAAPSREPVAIPASLSVEPGASASEAAEPTAIPAAPSESSTGAPAPTDRKRDRRLRSPRATSQPADIAAAIQAAQARADAFLGGRPASSVEPNSTR